MEDAITALHMIAKPGELFHVKDFQARVECTRHDLAKILGALRHSGHVEFTGKVCIWKRLR
jgi:DNA-binding IscR family transcriptional regulator